MNYYEAIGVKRTASKEEILEALELVRKDLELPDYARSGEYKDIDKELHS